MKPILNEKGSVLLMVFSLGAVALIISAALMTQSHNLLKQAKATENLIEKHSIQSELYTVLTNPTLCSSITKDGANNFQLGTSLAPNASIGRHTKINTLQITNIVNLGGSSRKADFQIQLTNDVGQRTIKVSAKYNDNGTTISNCATELTKEFACNASGLDFNTGENRCNICENLGGVWNQITNICDIPN